MRARTALVRGTALLLGTLVLAVSAAALWLRLRDPVAALPRDDVTRLVAVAERTEGWEGRLLSHVTLESAALGEIRFTVSLPDPRPPRPLPVVVVLGGLRTGADNVRVFGEAGPNAVVGFDWPIPRRIPTGGELLRRLPELYERVLSAPGQVDAVIAWSAQQPWADGERVSLLGFSLGALVGPAAQRLVERREGEIGWTVLAYGGAPLSALVRGERRVGPAPVRAVAGAVAGLLLRPVEPAIHLPELSGPFLVLGAPDDRRIPPEATERMLALAPEPRTVVRLEGGHIGTGARYQALLDRVVDLTRDWLATQGAIDVLPRSGEAGGSIPVRPARDRGGEAPPAPLPGCSCAGRLFR